MGLFYAEKIVSTSELVFVVLAFLCAGLISFVMTPVAEFLAHKLKLIDVPRDKRRMHTDSVPLFGGFAIVLGTLVMILALVPLNKTILAGVAGAVVLAVLGALDDKFDLPAWIKLIVQIVAAAIPVCFGLRIQFVALGLTETMWVSVPLTILWLVGMTNAVNFIDGLDGLASGVCAISGVSLCLLAVLMGRYDSALITAALSGACLGFLPFNRHPAKIFMGDMGATFLGYILAFVSVYGLFKTSALISFVGPVIVMALPIFDVLIAILRRVSKGQSPMQSDRAHIHHYLVDHGLSQVTAVRLIYLICLLCSLVAVVLALFGWKAAVIVLAVLALLALLAVFFLRKRGKNDG